MGDHLLHSSQPQWVAELQSVSPKKKPITEYSSLSCYFEGEFYRIQAFSIANLSELHKEDNFFSSFLYKVIIKQLHFSS